MPKKVHIRTSVEEAIDFYEPGLTVTKVEGKKGIWRIRIAGASFDFAIAVLKKKDNYMLFEVSPNIFTGKNTGAIKLIATDLNKWEVAFHLPYLINNARHFENLYRRQIV